MFRPAKDYSIVKSEGSDRGKSIVRKVLDHESEMANHSDEHAVTARNYDFALLGRELVNGRDCYVLQLSPRRQAVELIRGKAWVDANSFTVAANGRHTRQESVNVDQEPDCHHRL